MNLPRRQFLLKSFVGFLSISLLPSAYSLFKTFEASSLSVDRLFSELSFSKASFSTQKLNQLFGAAEQEGLEKSINSERILHAGKTICIPRLNDVTPQYKEHIIQVHQKLSDGFQQVLSLNQWEMLAMQKMLVNLKKDHGITESKQLRAMLIPVLKTSQHRSDKKIIEGDCSSGNGYYTEHGYCSIRVISQGSSMKISTSLRNHGKSVTHQHTFEINGIA